VPILITSDMHWNDRACDAYRHDFVRTLVRWVRKYDVDVVMVLGDLTEEKDRHGAWLVNQVFSHIHRLGRRCEVYVLRGNHDCLITSIPFFGSLGKLRRVEWINDPTIVEGLPLPGGRALFLPHTRNHERDWGELDVRGDHYVFTHNTFAGARAETGIKLDGIPRSLFSKRQCVISGDVHVPQVLGPVTYVGAPYPINFGDDFPARVILLDEDGSERSLRYKGPRKMVVDLTPAEVPGTPGGLRSGDILKVRLHLKPGGAQEAFRDCKERIVEYYRRRGCVVHLVQPIVEKGTARLARGRSRLRRRSDREIVEAYAATRDASERVLKTGLRLLRKT